MDYLFLYTGLLLVAIGSFSMLCAYFFRDLKKTITKKQDAIITKQDAIMAKLIDIKFR